MDKFCMPLEHKKKNLRIFHYRTVGLDTDGLILRLNSMRFLSFQRFREIIIYNVIGY